MVCDVLLMWTLEAVVRDCAEAGVGEPGNAGEEGVCVVCDSNRSTKGLRKRREMLVFENDEMVKGGLLGGLRRKDETQVEPANVSGHEQMRDYRENAAKARQESQKRDMCMTFSGCEASLKFCSVLL